jgi:hypothetical protein
MCTLDPHVPMLKGLMGPSSFPRIMSLEVVFQICFGSIKMMGTRGVLVRGTNIKQEVLLDAGVPL